MRKLRQRTRTEDSPKRAGSELLVPDRSGFYGVGGTSRPEPRPVGSTSCSSARGGRERSFATLARLAMRLRLLSVVNVTSDNHSATIEAEREEVRALVDLALRPASTSREFDVKRSLFASVPSSRNDNLHVLLDAALDADAARLRAASRAARRIEAPAAVLAR